MHNMTTWPAAAAPAEAGWIRVWGTQIPELLDAPAGNDFVAIASGDRHLLALREDGSLVAWGEIEYAPAGNDFVKADIGFGGGLALHSDGSLAPWFGGTSPPSGKSLDITGGFLCPAAIQILKPSAMLLLAAGLLGLLPWIGHLARSLVRPG